MRKEAYHALHSLENEHWWYVGARAAYATLLQMGLGRPRGSLRVLEVGSGSGANFPLLEQFGPTAGAEPFATPLQLTPNRPALGLTQARAEVLPFANNSFDCVALLGVIEHVQDDAAALREAARVCRPGGAVVLLTSALQVLWSHHDEANRHVRRYTRRQLRGVLVAAGLAPVRLSYQNFFTFLPTLLVRLWQRRAPRPPRYDMGHPPAFANALLTAALRLEAFLIRFVPLPIGVDLVGLCRKVEDGTSR